MLVQFHGYGGCTRCSKRAAFVVIGIPARHSQGPRGANGMFGHYTATQVDAATLSEYVIAFGRTSTANS